MKASKLYLAIILAALCIDLSGGQTWTNGLSFPSFTDTTDPNSWRSWICLANPYNGPADYSLEIWNQNGAYIGGKSGQLPALGSLFIRPKDIVGYDCAGSATVVSTIPITGILEKTRNNNQMTNSYSADRVEVEFITTSENVTEKTAIGDKTINS